VRALTIDFYNKLPGRCVLSGRNFLERFPEIIFEADTSRLAIDLFPICLFVRGRLAGRWLRGVIGAPYEVRFPRDPFVQFAGMSDVIFKFAVTLR
jgi:hypothetical protein